MADGRGIMMQSIFHTSENERSEEIVLTFDNGRVSWEQAYDRKAKQSSKTEHTIPEATTVSLEDIILAEVESIKSKGSNSDSLSSFSIHYVRRITYKKEKKLEPCSVKLFGSADNCTEWANTLQSALESTFPDRPKNVIAFVNPVSGKRQAAKIFDLSVRPLLEQFGVTHQVIVTERPGHTEDLLASMNLTGVDGILAVGGDGTLTEVVNGLARRMAADRGVDEDSPELPQLEPIPIPIGIIPTGTGNIIIEPLNESKDVVTATMGILLGGLVSKDIASFHSAGKLVRYSHLCSAVGLFVDWIRKAESNRWMGIGRIVWGAVYAFGRHSSVEYDIDFQPSERQREREEPRDEEETDQTSLPTGWCRRRGQFVQGDSYVFDPAGDNASVRGTFGDGEITLILVRPCSRTENLKLMGKFATKDPTVYDFDFVEVVKAREIRYRPIGGWKTNVNNLFVNIDGDTNHLKEPEFSVKLHKGLIRLFGVKLQKQEQS